jgi:hypothetical protein
MSVWDLRPKLADLVYAVYTRPLHPELFEIQRSQHTVGPDREFLIWMTDCGHVVSWRYEDIWLTEVLTAVDRPLPRARRLCVFRVRGERTETVQCAEVSFQLSVGVERLDPAVFRRLASELDEDARQQGALACRFPTCRRTSPASLSIVAPQVRANGLLVYAFHTFPEECGVVRTQTLYEILKQ